MNFEYAIVNLGQSDLYLVREIKCKVTEKDGLFMAHTNEFGFGSWGVSDESAMNSLLQLVIDTYHMLWHTGGREARERFATMDDVIKVRQPEAPRWVKRPATKCGIPTDGA